MNKAFEKILEILDEEREYSYADFDKYVNNCSPCLDSEYDDFFHRGLERSIKVIKEVAEEYNITNGDKIRSMSDEELAEWFETVTDDVMKGSCWNKEGWIKWLRSEAE